MEDLERMGRELKCPICLSLIHSAVSLTCNHLFCNSCIIKSMESAPSCPVCKIPFARREVRPAPQIDSLVTIYKNMEAAAKSLDEDKQCKGDSKSGMAVPFSRHLACMSASAGGLMGANNYAIFKHKGHESNDDIQLLPWLGLFVNLFISVFLIATVAIGREHFVFNVTVVSISVVILVLTATLLNNIVSFIGYGVICFIILLVFPCSLTKRGRDIYHKVNAFGGIKQQAVDMSVVTPTSDVGEVVEEGTVQPSLKKVRAAINAFKFLVKMTEMGDDSNEEEMSMLNDDSIV